MKYDKFTEKKARLDSFRPLPKALVRNLDDWFRVELTYTSNAIEGNTLTRRETALVVEKGLTVGGKSLIEHLEATNHVRALDWVQVQIEARTPAQITEADVLHIHDLILKGIDDENAGRYRTVPVESPGLRSFFRMHEKSPDLMAVYRMALSEQRSAPG